MKSLGLFCILFSGMVSSYEYLLVYIILYLFIVLISTTLKMYVCVRIYVGVSLFFNRFAILLPLFLVFVICIGGMYSRKTQFHNSFKKVLLNLYHFNIILLHCFLSHIFKREKERKRDILAST